MTNTEALSSFCKLGGGHWVKLVSLERLTDTSSCLTFAVNKLRSCQQMSGSSWHHLVQWATTSWRNSSNNNLQKFQSQQWQIISKSNTTAICVQIQIMQTNFSAFSFCSRISFSINSWDYNTIITTTKETSQPWNRTKNKILNTKSNGSFLI